MAKASARSLRSTVALAASLIGAVALVAAGFLIVFTTLLHREMRKTIVALEGVNGAAHVEYLIRQHRLTEHEQDRALVESEIRDDLRQAQLRARGSLELVAIRELGLETERLFAARRAQGTAAELNEQAQRTYDAITRVIDLEVAAAHDAELTSARWDRTANVVGVAVALALTLTAVVAVIWLRRDVLRPLVGLSTVMARHGSGSLAVRAPEVGVFELREMARRFNEMAEAQAQRQREQLDFVASIAHDLRTPLSALTTSTQLAVRHQGADHERLLGVIMRQADRLNRLVDELLDTARIEAGRLTLDLAVVDMEALASETVMLFRASSPDRQFVLQASPVLVRCDPNRVSQVLNNLVSNALKYSPASGRVEIDLSMEGELAVLRVRDEGIGLSKEDLPNLFKPYRRTNRGQSYASGTGLGLFGVKRIVEAHGGSITAESVLGHGATFVVRLPITGPSPTLVAGQTEEGPRRSLALAARAG